MKICATEAEMVLFLGLADEAERQAIEAELTGLSGIDEKV